MPASLPAVDRPIPTVAIVGTDAVLAAAPATPVQIAHACLRRGFTVAVPASWGDELVAAETMRQLATRERGPAVMCVCPFARARLLGPGADLAPFLRDSRWRLARGKDAHILWTDDYSSLFSIFRSR